MSNNWSTYLQNQLTLPVTVDDAVNRLLEILAPEDKLLISLMPKDKLSTLHFNLGMDIRNAFGLHNETSPLLNNCGVFHPDDASSIIIRALWAKLQEN